MIRSRGYYVTIYGTEMLEVQGIVGFYVVFSVCCFPLLFGLNGLRFQNIGIRIPHKFRWKSLKMGSIHPKPGSRETPETGLSSRKNQILQVVEVLVY